jgi:hypothetical protein
MRCKNCGWDNPAGNAKCEKCNAPLDGSMVDNRNLDETRDNVDGFDAKKTSMGCPNCGHPVKPLDKTCLNCSYQLRGEIGDGGNSSSPPQEGYIGGTVIGGGGIPDMNDEEDRRKLVGFLVSYTLDSNGVFFPLYEGKNYIGRNKTCNIYIQKDNKISEKHFSILYRAIDKKFKFKDEQSTNGTFVNGALLDEGELSNHNRIRIGSTELILLIIPQ